MTTPSLRVYQLPQETYATLSFPGLLRDKNPDEKSYILERYLSDVYALFLSKLSFFVINDPITTEEVTKLKALFDEMIKIKGLLVDKDSEGK